MGDGDAGKESGKEAARVVCVHVRACMCVLVWVCECVCVCVCVRACNFGYVEMLCEQWKKNFLCSLKPQEEVENGDASKESEELQEWRVLSVHVRVCACIYTFCFFSLSYFCSRSVSRLRILGLGGKVASKAPRKTARCSGRSSQLTDCVSK